MEDTKDVVVETRTLEKLLLDLRTKNNFTYIEIVDKLSKFRFNSRWKNCEKVGIWLDLSFFRRNIYNFRIIYVPSDKYNNGEK